MDNASIDDALEKYKSVYSLTSCPMSGNPVFECRSGFFAPAGFVFAFSSDSSLESLAVHLKEQRTMGNFPRHFSSIIVLDKGLIRYGEKIDVTHVNENPSSMSVSEILFETSVLGESLVNFTISLNHVLNSIILQLPNLDFYLIRSANHRLNSSFTLPFSLTADDLNMSCGNGMYIRDMKLFTEVMRSLSNVNGRGICEVLWDNHLATDVVRYYLLESIIERDRQGKHDIDGIFYNDKIKSLAENRSVLGDKEKTFSDEELIEYRNKLLSDLLKQNADKDEMSKCFYEFMADGGINNDTKKTIIEILKSAFYNLRKNQ